MAGVAGKSGGARPNSGGKRAGAGRKPKAATKQSANGPATAIEPQDMLTLLQAIALGQIEASTTQVRAAIAAVQYTHIKKGDGGKKDAQQDAAKTAAQGRFGAPPPPPRLVSGGNK